MDDMHCLGYVSSYRGAVMTIRELTGDTPNVCIPGEAEAEQLMDVILMYLRRHPELRHEPMRALTAIALVEKFPCKETNPLTANRLAPWPGQEKN